VQNRSRQRADGKTPGLKRQRKKLFSIFERGPKARTLVSLDDDKGSVIGPKMKKDNRMSESSPAFTSNSMSFVAMHFTSVLSGLNKTVFLESSSIAGGVNVVAGVVIQVQV
jgi:hypothetical protein